MQEIELETGTICPLPTIWRERAQWLREMIAAEQAARSFERAASELDQWLMEQADEVLTVSQAAERVGRDPSTISKAIRSGLIENVGRKHKPAVRARDLASRYGRNALRKRGAVAAKPQRGYDVRADARSLLARRGE